MQLRHFQKRLLQLVLVALAVTAVTFAMVNLLPGDAANALAGPQATPEDLRAARRSLGLDAPVDRPLRQMAAAHGPGGPGLFLPFREPVLEAILARLPVTVELMILAQLFALILAVPAGIAAACRPRSPVDGTLTAVAFAFMSTPVFVMALVLILVFALRFHWLPATGYVPVTQGLTGNLRSMVLPCLSVALVEWVPLMRVLRSDMIATLQEEYILAARSKGLSTGRIIFCHALRPSSFSLVTVFGLHMGHLLGGALIIEMIFALPGMGRMLINAMLNRDLFVVQGGILFISVAYVVVNGLVDWVYGILDPRGEKIWKKRLTVPLSADPKQSGRRVPCWGKPSGWRPCGSSSSPCWQRQPPCGPCRLTMRWTGTIPPPSREPGGRITAMDDSGAWQTRDCVHLLGTDTMGRDILARLIRGGRISLQVGLIAPILGLVVGGLLGMAAGYFGGWLEQAILMLTDAILAFPGMVLLLAVTFYFGPSLPNIIGALGFLAIPAFIRVARAGTLKYTSMPFGPERPDAGSGPFERSFWRNPAQHRPVPYGLRPAGGLLHDRCRGRPELSGIERAGAGTELGRHDRRGQGGARHPSPCEPAAGPGPHGDGAFLQPGGRRPPWVGRCQGGTVVNGGAPLLAVASLAVRLSTPRGVVHPLCGVSFGVQAGETLAVVGESGSGKSMLCRTLMGILPRSAKIDAHARIQYNGTELTGLSEARYNGIRGREIAMVFQDPGAALNPVMPIGRQVAEPLRVHLKLTAARARRQVMDLLREVEVPDPGRLMDHYPHQLSGGMRQRVAMAMALACEPRLLIADEPTTALDVTVQESLLDLMERFQARRKMAVILVSHDLRLAALRAGRGGGDVRRPDR